MHLPRLLSQSGCGPVLLCTLVAGGRVALLPVACHPSLLSYCTVVAMSRPEPDVYELASSTRLLTRRSWLPVTLDVYWYI